MVLCNIWRGRLVAHLAVASLRARFTRPASRVGLLLGVVWAFWYLPLLSVDTAALHGLAWLLETGPTVVLQVPNIVGFAFLLTWVCNRTGSVLLAPLTHAGIDTANSTLVPFPLEVLGGDAYPTVLLTVTAAVRVVAAALVLRTRGRLGYDADGRQWTP